MERKKKNVILIILIVFVGLPLIGGTYALLSYIISVSGGNYNTVTTCFNVNYSGTSHTDKLPVNGYLFQSSTPQGGLLNEVAMSLDLTCGIKAVGNIYLMVEDDTGSVLLSEGALKYAVYDNLDSDPIASGSITSKGDKLLYGNFPLSGNEKKYYVYIWLDGNIADNDYANIPFDGYLHATAEQINLPSEYQQIEFVQSNGTQYIDTGVSVKSNTMIIFDAAFLEGTHNGEEYVSSQDYNFIGSYGNRTGLAFATYNGKFRFWNTAPQTQVFQYSYNTRYKIILNDNGVYSVNGTNVALTAYNVSENPNSIYIFAAQHTGSVGSPLKPGAMKFYGAEIYENGEILRDFIPVKSSDGVIGLYDLVNEEFYDNDGTGTFVAGPEV